ncbi:MAG: hypothetical protein HFI23_12865 [Lachnospiraceae bacterium]|nr:hypothetical protein [Lachnospiraceae bacterium]
MIELHGQAGLPYVNRNAYSGSFRGMRYRLKKKAAEEGTSLEAVIYPARGTRRWRGRWAAGRR